MGKKEKSSKRGKLNFVVGLVAIVLIIGAVVNYQPHSVLEDLQTPEPTQEIVATPEPTVEPTPVPTEAPATAESGQQFEYRSVNYLNAKHGKLSEANWDVNENTLFTLFEESEKGAAWITLEDNFDNVVDLITNQGCSQYERLDYAYYAYRSDGMFDMAISFCVEKPLIEQIMNGSVDKTGMKDKVTDLYINESFYSG